MRSRTHSLNFLRSDETNMHVMCVRADVAMAQERPAAWVTMSAFGSGEIGLGDRYRPIRCLADASVSASLTARINEVCCLSVASQVP
jgi:hypothetical protein